MKATHYLPLLLIAISDPVIHPEVSHIAAATGCELFDSTDPAEILRLLPRAEALIIDAACAHDLHEYAQHNEIAIPSRERIFHVTAEPGPIDYRSALRCHAEEAFLVPSQAPELLAALGKHRMPHGQGRSAHQNRCIAISGAVGGSGVSTLSAALARTAAAEGQYQCIGLLDLVESSGGLDLLLGVEDTPGIRWPDLSLGEGHIDYEALDQAIPHTSYDHIGVLSQARSSVAGAGSLTDAVPTIRRVIHSIHEAATSVLGVLDCPTIFGQPENNLAQLISEEADLVVLVVPAEIRAVAAAAGRSAELKSAGINPLIVLRHRSWSGLGVKEVEDILQEEVLVEIGHIHRLPKTTELQGLPQVLPRPLLHASRAVLNQLPPQAREAA